MVQKRSGAGGALGCMRTCRAAGLTGEPGDSESGQGWRARWEPDQISQGLSATLRHLDLI